MKYRVKYYVNGMMTGKTNCTFWNGYFYLSDLGKAPGLYELFADIIIKGCRCCHEILGCDPMTIVTPAQQWYFEWCFQNNHKLQFASSYFTGQITYYLPSHPVLTLTKDIPLEGKQICSRVPVEGETVFTDGSGKTGKAAVAWKKYNH